MSLSAASSFLNDLTWPASIQGDVFFEARQQRSLGWAEGKPSLHEESMGEVMAVRVLEKGAEGIVATRNILPSNFSALAEEARALAVVAPADPTRCLASPVPAPADVLKTDDALFQLSSDHILARMQDLERRVLSIDKRLKKIVKFHFAETGIYCALRNTFGVSSDTAFSDTRFMAEILAEENGETEVAWDSSSARFGRDINMDAMALDLAQHALSALGARALPTGDYAVVLAPRVGVQILDLLAEALSAEVVQMGRSFLSRKKDQSVGSPVLTIVDDPLLPDGIASAARDDEGTPRRALTMLDGGVLKNFFYDLRTGARDGVSSNGRGHRASASSAPKPSATNFYVKAGSMKLEDMLSAADSVFLVRDVMGLHMADRITGEFSLGASGILYRQGRPAYAVRGVTMAGLVSDVLSRVQTVGNDFRWYGSVGCPSLFVKSLSIAGA